MSRWYLALFDWNHYLPLRVPNTFLRAIRSPDVVTETRKMQQQCDAAEARVQAARTAFDKARKPLEAVVRLQREELARRKVGGGEGERH